MGLNHNKLFHKQIHQKTCKQHQYLIVPPYLITNLANFWNTSCGYNYHFVKGFGKKIFDGKSPMDYDIVVFIWNQNNLHLCIIVVYPKKGIIDTWDSLHGGFYDDEKEVVKRLYWWLFDEIAINHGMKDAAQFVNQEWKFWCGRPVPRQENGHDCGVFSLAFAFCLVRNFDPESIKQEYIDEIRLFFMQEIFNSTSVLDNDVKDKLLNVANVRDLTKLDEDIQNMNLDRPTYFKYLGISSETGYVNPTKYPPKVNSMDTSGEDKKMDEENKGDKKKKDEEKKKANQENSQKEADKPNKEGTPQVTQSPTMSQESEQDKSGTSSKSQPTNAQDDSSASNPLGRDNDQNSKSGRKQQDHNLPPPGKKAPPTTDPPEQKSSYCSYGIADACNVPEAPLVLCESVGCDRNLHLVCEIDYMNNSFKGINFPSRHFCYMCLQEESIKISMEETASNQKNFSNAKRPPNPTNPDDDNAKKSNNPEQVLNEDSNLENEKDISNAKKPPKPTNPDDDVAKKSNKPEQGLDEDSSSENSDSDSPHYKDSDDEEDQSSQSEDDDDDEDYVQGGKSNDNPYAKKKSRPKRKVASPSKSPGKTPRKAVASKSPKKSLSQKIKKQLFS